MTAHRHHLPQLRGGLFLADGGLETTLIHHDGLDLPYFAAFDLLRDDAGRAILTRYFERYARLARERAIGAVLETPTWRASRDWGARLGYSPEQPRGAEPQRGRARRRTARPARDPARRSW